MVGRLTRVPQVQPARPWKEGWKPLLQAGNTTTNRKLFGSALKP